MAQVIVWGLTFSTLLTLLVVPCLYRLDVDIAVACVRTGLRPMTRWVTDPGAAAVDEPADTYRGVAGRPLVASRLREAARRTSWPSVSTTRSSGSRAEVAASAALWRSHSRTRAPRWRCRGDGTTGFKRSSQPSSRRAAPRAWAFACDVTDEASVAEAGSKGRSNARPASMSRSPMQGFRSRGSIEKLSAADWRRQLDVNVIGPGDDRALRDPPPAASTQGSPGAGGQRRFA